jgi:hypothetical protein
MSRREEASKLNSENIGPVKRIRPVFMARKRTSGPDSRVHVSEERLVRFATDLLIPQVSHQVHLRGATCWQAGIGRVKGAKRLGVRIGNWLSVEQSRTLLAESGGDGLRGKRDRAILALLIGCGLQRAELVGLRLPRRGLHVANIPDTASFVQDCRGSTVTKVVSQTDAPTRLPTSFWPPDVQTHSPGRVRY